MKSNPIFVAAAGFAMVGACSVTTKDENATDADENSTATAPAGSVLPITEEDARTDQADTLGNQLNQLEGDANETAAGNASDQQ